MSSKLLAALLKSCGTRIRRRRLLHSLIYEKRTTCVYTSIYLVYRRTFLLTLNGFSLCDTPNQNVVRVLAITPRNTQCITSTVVPAQRSKGLCMHKMLAPLMPICCIMNNALMTYTNKYWYKAKTYWDILVNGVSGVCHN